MQVVFIKLLNMSITASWLVLAVVVLRQLLKKAPKSFTVVLWALVAIRLIVPFSIESAVSLIPSTQTIPNKVLTEQSFNVNTGIDYVDNRVNDYLGDNYFEGVTVPEDNGMEVMSGLTVVWMVGVVLMLAYTFVSYYGIHKKVAEAAYWKDKIWLCDHIDTPFVLGVIATRIYIPSSLSEEDMEYVIAHENAHISRRDNWWKPLGFLLLTVYWFNPVLWLAYILFCRDIELACDENVIKMLGVESKKPYADALINCSVPRSSIAACPIAFGEVGVKRRLKSILNYKKPAFWIVIVAVIACVAVTVFFLTDPLKTDKETVADAEQQESLMEFLEYEFRDHNFIESFDGSYQCADCEILEVKESGNEVTVYLWGMYRIYNYENGLNVESSVHIPAIITAEKGALAYSLLDYWQPRDGSYYADDIKSKFPKHLQSKALESQQYVQAQSDRCEAKAITHYSSMYVYEDADNPYGEKPGLYLDREEKTYSFGYCSFLSDFNIGEYELTEDTLTLRRDRNGEKYVFKVEGKNLVFDEARSSELHKIGGIDWVPDGAVFKPIANE